MQEYWEIENFLTNEECQILLNNYNHSLKLEKAKVTIGFENSISKLRKSSVAFIDNIEIIDNKLKKILKNIIHIKGFEAIGIGPYQFTKYEIGDYFDWHTDSSEQYRERFFSIVIQLNDDYDGGCLELKTNNNIINLKKSIGKLFIFYSNVKHRVTKVNNGIRYTLVNWVSIEKTDISKQNII